MILIGHSIAGEEMTRFAGQYPDRVDKLVYLDAAYDRVAADSMLSEIFPVPPDVPSRPQPTAADTATRRGVRRVRAPDARREHSRVRHPHALSLRRMGRGDRARLPVDQRGAPAVPRACSAPALAIYAVTDTVAQLEPWQRSDREHAAAWQDVIRGIDRVDRSSRDQFRREVEHGTVLEIHGAHHWVFVSNRDEVLRAVRRFLGVE